ncbi:MAG: exosome complex protein Rrp42 [Aigarchaeota archaeon]|nr:exosome complex protein Rrp42 [Aigarchaeota archaeon]MCX8193627.1 exosome complex protein Rrp42 [Nitrososphaeria archaeon]MDW7987027.1 exosome complex protein Rrp42 [Nitrososphaerota archaeon]
MSAIPPQSKKSLIAGIVQEKIYNLLQQGKRLDGRSPVDLRPITITTGIVEKADGSSLVSLGKTKILVGIKTEIGTPYPDRPKEGSFTVNAELLPLASIGFEPGPPDERGVELARVVDRSIRESKAIDLEKLCLIEGEKAYILFIDIYVLDYDGNYYDPSVIAALAALVTAKIPKYEVVGGKVQKTGEYFNLKLQKLPFTTTFGLIRGKFLVDPQLEEEAALDVSIIIGVDQEGNIVSIQKNSPGLIPETILEQLIEIAQEKTNAIRNKFCEALNIVI